MSSTFLNSCGSDPSLPSGPNPIESYRSNSDRALDRDGFGHALFEWRCYPSKPRHDLLGTFDIPIGPFRFRPLSLIEARFAIRGSDSNPLELDGADILGGLSFRADGRDGAHEDFAFSADRICDRDDLFVFRNAGWPRWKGAAVAPGKTADEIIWQDRAPNLTFTRHLPVESAGAGAWFASDTGVDARITLGFDNAGSDPAPETATLHARLFGQDRANIDISGPEFNFVRPIRCSVPACDGLDQA